MNEILKRVSSFFMTSLFIIGKARAQPYLFKKFPKLQDQIPHISFCDLPTPIVKLERFGKHIGCENIFMKRDDLTGKVMEDGSRLYGGNKPRKLEFLLADAVHKNARAVVTCGSAGSNHAVATTVYAQLVGLQTILLLKPQPNSHVVRQNLLLDYYYGAQLQSFADKQMRNAAFEALVQADNFLYGIPAGGSTPLGVLGFVNAAFELAEQIAHQEICEPDLLYVANGSCATTAGLLLGIQAAALKTKVVAVCVEPEEFPDEFLVQIRALFHATNELLHAADASFPLCEFPEQALTINKKFCGTRYGFATSDVVDVICMIEETEQVRLEGTYSAKAIAALFDDAEQGIVQGKTILFWNTYCGLDFSAQANSIKYTSLPADFHSYFEEDVQP